ncbi:PREDICTED: uncharacterized protein LOC109183977 isoform X2 [Ipomoea nil]|uniref:uncharacterized protein LOC109183977 isoform X2 n=1 Tax=Ipomoea nil TaxID=35883 RepID=UPI000901068D|nr:PREDICTED: uncharacterized protein LOC109183977 isoform X2 [Ipomoea nil]
MKHGGGGRKKQQLTDDKGADAHHNRRDNLAGLTLFAILGGDEAPATSHAQQTRTLLDVIKDDSNGKDNKKTWKHFKEKLRLKPSGGAAWTSTVPVPASDVPMNNRSMSRRHSNRVADAEYPGGEYKPELTASSSRRELRSTPSNRMSLTRNESRTGNRSLKLQGSMSIRRGGEAESEGGEEGEGDEPMRMSLMALLGDQLMEEEEEDGGSCEDYGGEFRNCCVCMVRHKGEAFDPCGHTFCRLCSRELWAEKGKTCPLCNNFILEILDIF